ncbi:response regulator [Azospirillum brasilense]|uniref:Response regulatory domain-containing protein n=1 Tax=Azospirillum brasilense TaxID=192 RepID=A0A235HB50_AZOBR|nr:response regulator [Azospirillum brasilense]OYD82942.1 hypothetical protein CHT98_17500 [Azospirillum brasilense]
MRNTGSRRLVVDGDPAIRFHLRKVPTNEGYAVILPADSEPVLRMVAEPSPDLVLLDLDPPDREGIGVMDAIRTLRRTIEADPERPNLVLTEPGAGYRLQTSTDSAGFQRRSGGA